MSNVQAPTRVLFVCLGNICRSPLAKFVAMDLVSKRGLADRIRLDSCGTGHWHVGGPADPRTVNVARRYGLPSQHTARQLCTDDWDAFDWLIAMDRSNGETIIRRGGPREKVRLMRSFDPTFSDAPRAFPHGGVVPDVPDPYTGGPEGFEEVYRLLLAACQGMIDELAG